MCLFKLNYLNLHKIFTCPFYDAVQRRKHLSYLGRMSQACLAQYLPFPLGGRPFMWMRPLWFYIYKWFSSCLCIHGIQLAAYLTHILSYIFQFMLSILNTGFWFHMPLIWLFSAQVVSWALWDNPTISMQSYFIKSFKNLEWYLIHF